MGRDAMKIVKDNTTESKADNVIEYDFELKKIEQYRENREYEKYVYFLKEHEEKNPEEVNILLAHFFLFEKSAQVDNAEGVKSAEKLIKMGVKEGWFFMGMSRLLGKGLPRDVAKGRKYIKMYLAKLEADNDGSDRNKDYELLARLHLAKELFVWKKSKLSDLQEARQNYEYARERDVDCYTEINELAKKINLTQKNRKKKIVKTIIAFIILIAILGAVGYFVFYKQINLLEMLADLFAKF